MNRNINYKQIAYLGIPGSYSFIASNRYFGKGIIMIGQNSFDSVLKIVRNNTDFAGIVPLENSTSGSIAEVFDLLLKYNLSIVGEIFLKIHHHILSKKNVKNGNNFKQISLCYSHPQAIMQCKSFFQKNPQIKSVLTSDTATAAKTLSLSASSNEIAIGSNEAANIYGLKILKKNIEDNKKNYTRFVVVAENKNRQGNKISLVFSVKHVPGSLFKALSPYAKYGLNLTKIESRPVFGKPWEYIFFLDFEIGKNDKKVNLIVSEMKKYAQFIKILGRYEKGRTYET